MKWKFRRTQHSSANEPATTTPAETTLPPQGSRRGLFGMLKTAGVAAIAVTGVGALVQHNAPIAYASTGSFSSNGGGPAVTAAGTNGAYGLYASSDTTIGVYATSNSDFGVMGTTNTSGAGVYGVGNNGYGVFGNSYYNNGVYGYSTQNSGVYGYSYANVGTTGFSNNNWGVYGTSNQSIGVMGVSSGTHGVCGLSGNYSGVYSVSYSTTQPSIYATGGSVAGIFNGDVQVNGSLSKGGGSFLIDHPLDPANKKLYHSFVESPDMKNIYDGVVTLDQKGSAVVTLPAWFSALNRDFCYQLTGLGSFAPVCITQKIQDNQFSIGGEPGMEVSWQVTGIRQDAWAQKYRIPVEEDKSAAERGLYYHPDVFGHPADKGIHQRPDIKVPPRQSIPPTPTIPPKP